MKKIGLITLRIFAGLFFVLGYALYIVCKWSVIAFGVTIDDILFTLSAPLNGADSNVASEAIAMCLPRILLVLAAYILYVVLDVAIKNRAVITLKIKKLSLRFNIRYIIRTLVALASVFVLLFGVKFVVDEYGIIYYFVNKNAQTSVYDTYYVDPDEANITLATEDGKYRNLIYVYVESMETTYTSVENGGRQDICYIPNLVELANNNVTFSNTDKLGGFHNVRGTTYTMGALLSTSSGIPFSFPIEFNSMNTRQNFASGLTTLGDILDGFGYKQEFLCGSDADFAGRRNYYAQHGNYEIFDYYTAKEKGYIAEDYWVFWGYEDMYLYEIAKDEITRLAEGDQPFNFTMLTVDTHHISGYVCELCGDEYDMQTKNVVSCADKQVAAFIEWCQQQPFYENTSIIVTGDHPRMDNDMVEGVDYFDRTVYNCFINCETGDVSQLNTTNRTFTPMDIFPTTMAALGFKWDGNRLGLGTNLFSSQQTVAEEIGYDWFNQQLQQKSYYYERFY